MTNDIFTDNQATAIDAASAATAAVQIEFYAAIALFNKSKNSADLGRALALGEKSNAMFKHAFSETLERLERESLSLHPVQLTPIKVEIELESEK